MRSAIRRVPRKVGQGNEEDDAGINPTSESETVVKRPAKTSKPSSKFTKSSNLRTSFPALAPAEDEEGHTSTIFKAQPSRHIIEHSVQLRPSAANTLPLRAGSVESRPDYTPAHLAELKLSTPSTPLHLEDDAPGLDIGSKFGDSALALTSLNDPTPSLIPSEAEIREKKERRRRLAREKDYISLNDESRTDGDVSAEDSDMEDPRSKSLILPAEDLEVTSKYGESRLVHDDEDIAEGFDEFVEDTGRVTLGRNAAKEQDRQRRRDIEDQIRSAQHGYGYDAGEDGPDSDESDEDEEVARNAAYDAAQTRAGAYGVVVGLKKEMDKEARLKRSIELPKIRPVPDFNTVVARFSEMVNAKEREIEMNKKRLAKLREEREEMEVDEARVKELLVEAGERYERLTRETVSKTEERIENGVENSAENDIAVEPRAVSNPGRTSERSSFGFSGGMARIPDDHDEYSD